jgi:purine-binding chemotaxis protein CheW
MSVRYCTFHVDGLLLGVDVELVQEVLGDAPQTRVPLADPCVLGLMNLRGQIVTAVDARRRLGLAPRATGEPSTNVVVRIAHESMSLVVDREGEVVDLDGRDIESLPENVSATIRNFVTGACNIDQSLLLLLDTPRLLAVGSD